MQDFLDQFKIQYFSAAELTYLRREDEHRTPPQNLWHNIIPTVTIADCIRKLWGAPIYVTSAWRPDWYNELVGGSPTSEHKKFRAMDIHVEDMDAFYPVAKAVVEAARARGLNVGLLRYESFIHIDVNAAAYKSKNRTIDMR